MDRLEYSKFSIKEEPKKALSGLPIDVVANGRKELSGLVEELPSVVYQKKKAINPEKTISKTNYTPFIVVVFIVLVILWASR